MFLVSPYDELGQDGRAAATMTTCSPLNRTWKRLLTRSDEDF